ncbi:ComEC/Rec2 family competence protein [Mucilaginibacter pocheonensis]|uniref:Beta-lactamase superfamily II metal-dependent hydrolase n=1 Tax=Mucilaginibacter pocheonensis TaxID=398050 RepID=A0ABU1T8E5_9SPHI|nr:MBL fold metallo-hydrolase [Mucilaginibacter pocheonensis]MDR6941680.1 beta-lactamase superfamily II metal-dependent hydrolase [Mucilaginibacter pocheonensis]
MELRYLSVGCADAIHILLPGPGGRDQHILVDSGSERGDYPGTLRQEMEAIAARGESIDRWIITHIDDDHIGGLLRFLSDTPLRNQLPLDHTEIWFNYCEPDPGLRLGNREKKSVGQAIRLRDYLRANSRLSEQLTTDSRPAAIGELQFTLLSPTAAKLEQLAAQWQLEEESRTARQQKSARQSDYGIRLEAFDPDTQGTDPNVFNGSSIACLLDYRGKRVLLTGDSHPEVLVAQLKALGYADADDRRLVLDHLQLAHHGSEANTSAELLRLIDCRRFVINANGIKHNLPNKRLLARLRACYPGQQLQVYLTHDNRFTRSILAVDQPLQDLELIFPPAGQKYISLSL